MCSLSHPHRRIRYRLLAVIAAVCLGPAACRTSSDKHVEKAPQSVFVVTCSGQIYNIDIVGSRLLASAVIYERAQGVPHGPGVDGCAAGHAAFDPARSELIVVAPHEASGERQPAQLIWLSSTGLQVRSVVLTPESLPATVLPTRSENDILLSAGVPGTPAAKIIRLDRSGKVLQTWTGGAFFSDARLETSETIFSRDFKISLQNGRAAADEITPERLIASDRGQSLRSFAVDGIITASLAASAGPNALFLLTTPGKPPAAAVVDLRNETVTVIPVPAATPLKGLHLSSDGSQLLLEEWTGAAERTGKLYIYDSSQTTAKGTWNAEALRTQDARFLCSGASRSWLYIKESSLLILREGSVSTVALPSPVDIESTCVTAPAGKP